ncbi:fumarylacetoacetate hydrolase family protein [Pararobbsia silviterrae]|uniref:FAA hydrolase family protein n=1 Tax=Pararobbsia silviterrae TaxID=1792498 RepID=A0A494Y7Y5_9BURK|nr:fumarylacetoacetate hydrolase family protein [Pararobbsia silviterrae]RKP58821.1 FAA hydrolase family protein [Pararobbsia silviterrae]
MTYAFPPAPVISVPVAGVDAQFPVRRIYCVGRNYEAHAREMGHDPNREPPFFFAKPADAIVVVPEGEIGEFRYPAQSEDVHHEIELVVALNGGGVNIDAERALDHVFGYAVGLDMTRRDLQAEAKKLGRPWDTGKGFDGSAPIGPIHRVEEIGHPTQGAVWLDIDGKQAQRGDLHELIWSVAETIAYLSRFFELKAGDLIFSGTPSGVGPVKHDQLLEGGVEGVGQIKLYVR